MEFRGSDGEAPWRFWTRARSPKKKTNMVHRCLLTHPAHVVTTCNNWTTRSCHQSCGEATSPIGSHFSADVNPHQKRWLHQINIHLRQHFHWMIPQIRTTIDDHGNRSPNLQPGPQVRKKHCWVGTPFVATSHFSKDSRIPWKNPLLSITSSILKHRHYILQVS